MFRPKNIAFSFHSHSHLHRYLIPFLVVLSSSIFTLQTDSLILQDKKRHLSLQNALPKTLVRAELFKMPRAVIFSHLELRKLGKYSKLMKIVSLSSVLISTQWELLELTYILLLTRDWWASRRASTSVLLSEA